jgi:CYTH domain-containing protein
MGKTEIETERRFLLKRMPRLKWDKNYTIEQYYLSDKGNVRTERIRSITDWNIDKKFYHTIKEPIEGSDMSVHETEGEITEEEFLTLWEKKDRMITKERRILNDGDLKWEVDVFNSVNLVIAEIELPSENYELTIPEELQDVILMEITGMHQFSNSQLAY